MAAYGHLAHCRGQLAIVGTMQGYLKRRRRPSEMRVNKKTQQIPQQSAVEWHKRHYVCCSVSMPALVCRWPTQSTTSASLTWHLCPQNPKAQHGPETLCNMVFRPKNLKILVLRALGKAFPQADLSATASRGLDSCDIKEFSEILNRCGNLD